MKEIIKLIINVIELFLVILFLYGLFIIDDEDYINKQNEKKEQELRKSERECRSKGMYPVRSGCSDLSSPTCHVYCWPEPQKHIDE